jgi:tetratricopeptide (TPR) repeat protein
MSSRSIRSLWLVIALVALFWKAIDVRAVEFHAVEDEEKYAFKLAPLEIYDKLNELGLGEPPALAADERRLLAGRWAAQSREIPPRITHDELRDALIFASGATKPEDAEKLRAAYDKLLAESNAELKDCKTPAERAEKLLAFLHRTAMKGGYDLHKTSFRELFDENKFNCVSSTSIYCLLGLAHDLELQPISIPGTEYTPGHATADVVIDGKRIQIEPTCDRGYDWEAKLKTPGVTFTSFGPGRDKGHDVSLWHLPAMVYYNRGNQFKKPDASEQMTMLRCYLAALCLAPTDASAARNLRSALTNWGPGLHEGKKFDDAVRVMEFAHRIAPGDAGIENNRSSAWQRRIMHLLESKRDAEAMDAAKEAIAALPEDSAFTPRTKWLQWLGQEIQAKEGFESALQVVDRAEKVLSAEEMKEIFAWRTNLIRIRAQKLLKEKNYQESLQVLKRFYDPNVENPGLNDAIAYHTQEALPVAEAKGKITEVLRHYRELRETFASCEKVSDIAVAFAHRSIAELLKKKDYDHAAARIEELLPLLEAEKNQIELREQFYQTWVSDLLKAKEWEAALAKALEASKAIPMSDDLKALGANVIIAWSKPSMDAKKWDEAIKIYELGLKHFPDHSSLTNNLEYCQQQKAK